MKPPIPSPYGKITRSEDPEFDGKERSLSYRVNVLASSRIQLKSSLFIPANYITILGVSIVLAVMLFPIGFRPLRSFPLWQSFSIIAFLTSLFMIVVGPLTIPLYTYVQLLLRGHDETVLINKDGIYNTAEKFPISIVWRRVKWIIVWSGDIFILTFGGGVLIPRHAFRTPQDAENFADAARQFRSRARETRRDSK